jgi:dTDP-4-dehydrorhamnose reductase
MTKIFATGSTGLVGSRIVELLKDKYLFKDLSFDTGVDITNPDTLDIIRQDKEHEIVLHLAAKADVDGCEEDKDLGTEGAAYKSNVVGTQNVVDACKEGNKKIIYISTDFVFDGENPPADGYKEEDATHPLNWYAETKYKGEEVVKNSGLPFLIARISYPYRKEFAGKKDFVRAIADRLANKQQVIAVTDHIFNPTFIDDIAYALGKLIETDSTGIFHVVGSQSLSPYDAALLIAEHFGYDESLISKTTRAEFFKDRALRPFNLQLNNDKIKRLGVTMRTFEEGLKQL